MIYIILCFVLFSPLIIVLFLLDKKHNKGKVHLYGIYGFFGLAGKGKTIAMCHYMRSLRKRYGDKILIMTNFHYLDQDFEFKTWKQLLQEYDKPLVVAWDEIPNEFNSRDFKNFPMALMTQLTQVRKGNGIQILYTAQKYHFVDKNFRSLSFGCYECNTWLGRFTFTKLYPSDFYEDRCTQTSVEKAHKVKPIKCDWFIQTEKLRNSYDSYKMLQTAKTKEYLTREEISIISAGSEG